MLLSKERAQELLAELESATNDSSEQSMERLMADYMRKAKEAEQERNFRINVASAAAQTASKAQPAPKGK